MRASLIVLAIILATLRVVQDTLGRRRGLALARPRRFTEWRYYGFSGHIAEPEDPDAERKEVVANSPAVGSVVSILPDDCVITVVNGRVYRQCGSVWYQRQYTGSKVTYVVVPAP